MLQFCQCLHWRYIPKLPSSIKLLAFLVSSWPLQKLVVQIQARMLELGSPWVLCNWQVSVTLTGLDLLPNWKDVEKHSRKTPWENIIDRIEKLMFWIILLVRRVKKKINSILTISRNFSFPPIWKKRRKNPSDFVKTIKTMIVKKQHLFHWLIFAKYKVNSLHQDDILLVDFDWTGQNHHIGEHWHWTDFHTSNIGFLDGVLCIMEEFGFYFKMLSVFCIKYPFFYLSRKRSFDIGL